MSTLFKRLAKVQTEGDATTLSGSEFHMLIIGRQYNTSNIMQYCTVVFTASWNDHQYVC